MSAEPVTLLSSLARFPQLPSRLHFMLGVPFSMAAADLPPSCSITTYGAMGTAGAIAQKRPVSLSMLHYGRADAVYQDGSWHADIALLMLAKAPDGKLYLAPAHGGALAAARKARHVIAQISTRAPCMLGAELPPDIRIDAMLENDDGLLEAPAAQPGTTEQVIAQFIAEMVPTGACLQVGIGAQPSAVIDALSGHRHLGIHSGMLTPPMWRLISSGAADQSRKKLDVGIAVTGCAFGDSAMYEAIHLNPAVVLRPPAYTHDPRVIAAQPHMFSLNSALEVDLLGAVNAEAVKLPTGAWRFVGGVGGLPDFVRAAVLAPQGQSVIALATRTPRGHRRIVSQLTGPATLGASDADVVVTEHGVARLRGLDMRARARAMIGIAHPEDRDALAREAATLGLI